MILKDKVFLVTGAGGGIGSEIVLTLIAKGAKVAAVDLRKEFLVELSKRVSERSDSLRTYAVDITDKKSVEKLPKQVISDMGQIDGIINNAGIIQPFIKVNEVDYAAIERVMNVNLYGVLYMTKAFLPELLKRPEAYVANVSSMGGFLPVPGQSIYGASKAAVKLMTEGLYAELRDTNVHVSVIFPGAINTHITENSGVGAPKLASENAKAQNFPMTSPSDAAKIIVAGIEKDKPQIFVGNDSKMMNFFYRVNPVYATNLIAKQMKSLLSK